MSLFPDFFQRLPDSKWNSMTFPWPWRNFIFPDHLLICGNHDCYSLRWELTGGTQSFFFVHKLIGNKLMRLFLASKIKMIEMLLNVVHRRVHKNICVKSFITNSILLTMHGHKAELWVKCVEALTTTVCYTAVLSVVTQHSSPQREKRDDTKNGSVADYYNYESPRSPKTFSRTQMQSSPLWFFLGYQTIPSL